MIEPLRKQTLTYIWLKSVILRLDRVSRSLGSIRRKRANWQLLHGQFQPIVINLRNLINNFSILIDIKIRLIKIYR